ncbi:MAG TPA: hypothetical protein VFX96_03645 [Pyrinomonadaceae bacterium]|nr:hypothetical protein [Pyrinomonadaceae bacterium]
MTEKRNKYDTDPLDPDFVRRTEEVESDETMPLAETQTAPMPPRPAPTVEEATRRFDGPPPGERFPSSYPSVFVPPVYNPPVNTSAGRTSYGAATPPPQQQYGPRQAYGQYANSRPSDRPVEKLGLPEKWANMLPYAPFYVGLVVALIELLVVPRTETRTRFHAAQGLALQIAILLASFVFSIVGLIADARFGGRIFSLAAFVFLIYSMWRVWQGRPHHIAPLDELTKKINERFEPRK